MALDGDIPSGKSTGTSNTAKPLSVTLHSLPTRVRGVEDDLDRHLIEQYKTCENAEAVSAMQEKILADLEKSYDESRRTDGESERTCWIGRGPVHLVQRVQWRHMCAGRCERRFISEIQDVRCD